MIRCEGWVAHTCEIETYIVMNGNEVIHGFSKGRGGCKLKTNKRKYSFLGHIKMKTIEILSHKTECVNRLKKELEDRFVGGY